jgi:hypothetical protein
MDGQNLLEVQTNAHTTGADFSTNQIPAKNSKQLSSEPVLQLRRNSNEKLSINAAQH